MTAWLWFFALVNWSRGFMVKWPWVFSLSDSNSARAELNISEIRRQITVISYAIDNFLLGFSVRAELSQPVSQLIQGTLNQKNLVKNGAISGNESDELPRHPRTVYY
jgi:hypothetical protein